MNTAEKIEKNAKNIKAILGLMITVVGLVYGVCIYVYQGKQCVMDIRSIRSELNEMKQEGDLKHKELDNKIIQNERLFQMTATKLDVSLAKISTDLQFIKESLMKKGLDK